MASLSYARDRKRWRVRWRATNRRAVSNRVFAGSRTFLEKAQAVRFYAEMEAQERLWRSGEVSAIESIAHVAEEFAKHCQRHTLRTREHYGQVMARFLEALPKNVGRIQQVERAHIEEYLYQLRDTGRINRTLNAHLTVLKAFCRYYSERYSIANPAAAVAMLTEDPPEVRFITRSEYEALLAATVKLQRDQELARDRIIFLANTGLRASEFCRLVEAGLRFTNNAITIVGKGRKRRTVPLNRHCREVLARPHIYRPVGRNPLYQQINRVGTLAGLEHVGPHSLRHYFATQLLLKGVPIITVAKLLGHRSVKTTERIYLHILDADIQDSTEVL